MREGGKAMNDSKLRVPEEEEVAMSETPRGVEATSPITGLLADGHELVRAGGRRRGEAGRGAGVAARAPRGAVSRTAAPPVAMPHSLSEREMQVLREAARGLPNKDIARRLNLSVRTVHTHLGNIFTKLSVGSRTEAVLLALRRGWIALEDTEAVAPYQPSPHHPSRRTP